MASPDWGYHMILDLENCNSKIGDEATIRNWLKALVEGIGMTAHGEPQIERFANDYAEGYSAVQLIETSAITAHFAEQVHGAVVDVFSCKPFDMARVLEISQRHFGGEISQFTTVRRGCGWLVNDTEALNGHQSK